MLTFTRAMSSLTTCNLPWFMDLTFQVPMQYCFLQHQTLLLSPVTSTTGYCFCFGSILSFFLELYLHWSPVAYQAPTNLGSSSFSILSFCIFILFIVITKAVYGWLESNPIFFFLPIHLLPCLPLSPPAPLQCRLEYSSAFCTTGWCHHQ